MATNPPWRRSRARLGSRLAVPPAVAFATALGLVTFQTASRAVGPAAAGPRARGRAEPDRAPRGDLPGERLLRSLLRYLPEAANTSGQPFRAPPGTPKVNNLANTPGPGATGTLLTTNPSQGGQRPPEHTRTGRTPRSSSPTTTPTAG